MSLQQSLKPIDLDGSIEEIREKLEEMLVITVSRCLLECDSMTEECILDDDV